MLLLSEAQNVEARFASGHKVEALRQTRELALRFLPSHLPRLEAFAARFRTGVWHLPRDTFRIEADFYSWFGQAPPDDRIAAAALTYCAKWMTNEPPDNANIQVRDDYAYEAFVCLLRLVNSCAPETGQIGAQHAQEAAVVAKLIELGYDPLSLPRNTPGKPGVKARVKAALGGKGVWGKPTVFTHTWDRLASNVKLQYQAGTPP